MGLSKKDLQRSLLSDGENSSDTCRRLTKILRMLYQHINTASLDGKEQREDEMKEGCYTLKILEAGKRLMNYSVANMYYPLGKKDEPRARWMELRATEDQTQALKPKVVCLVGFCNCLRPITPFFLQFSPFLNGNTYNYYPMLVPPLYSGSK